MDWIKNILAHLDNPKRSKAIDFYRSIAVLSVVAFHFGPFLPYGYLGVDIFFVISGFLVGGILVEQYLNSKIHFWKFIVQRGFKIWPSYYVFLIIAGTISFLYYSNSSHPDLFIPFNDLKRYIFFYRNFTGEPHHWNFDHVWSLCIEEHFYILLPLSLLIANLIPLSKKTKIYSIIGLFIFSGIFFKYLAYFYTNGKDTYAATYNRLDSLSYGVLLYMVIHYPITKRILNKSFWFCLGFFGFFLSIFIQSKEIWVLYDKIWFHSIIPFFVASIIFATYESTFRHTKGLRFLSYFSYNWYLWHPFLVYFIYDHIGNNGKGFLVYLLVSFTFAVVFTKWIEEPFLKIRRKYIDGKIENISL